MCFIILQILFGQLLILLKHFLKTKELRTVVCAQFAQDAPALSSLRCIFGHCNFSKSPLCFPVSKSELAFQTDRPPDGIAFPQIHPKTAPPLWRVRILSVFVFFQVIRFWLLIP